MRPPFSAVPSRAVQPDQLPGLWRRRIISWPGGGSDTATRVRWLQGTRAYIDLRQPPRLWQPAGPGGVLPALAHARGLADLSLEDCLLLARQEGFAGELSFDGNGFVWERTIDYQPPSDCVDAGSLRWEGGLLVEDGRDAAYQERWQREPDTPTQPRCALALWDPAGRVRGRLLRVGPFFMFVRDRAAALKPSGSLETAVAASASLEEARVLVGCEISFGSIHRGRFRISASTLPWRVGTPLEPAAEGGWLRTAETDGPRRWEITSVEGETGELAA